MSIIIENDYENLSNENKKIKLYYDQKQILDGFLRAGAITKAQYDKSFGDLTKKMGVFESGLLKEVVAGLIFDGDRFLICKRPLNKARGGLFEFVGGKVENNESKEDTLIRECKEELDVLIEVGEEFTSVLHFYDDLTVHLTVFNAKITSGNLKLLEHSEIRWILPSEIDNYEFCGADTEILRLIKEKFSK